VGSGNGIGLLSGLYQLFDLCLIKHVLTVSTLATHFKISVCGHQTMFDDVWSPNISRLYRPFPSSGILKALILFVIVTTITKLNLGHSDKFEIRN